MGDKLNIEIELVPIAEGMEHPIGYFEDEIATLFEQFGYKIVWSSYGGEVKDTEEEDE